MIIVDFHIVWRNCLTILLARLNWLFWLFCLRTVILLVAVGHMAGPGANPAVANPAGSVSSAVGANSVANWAVAGGHQSTGGHGTTAAALAQLAAAQNQALQIAAAQQVGRSSSIQLSSPRKQTSIFRKTQMQSNLQLQFLGHVQGISGLCFLHTARDD